MWRYFIEKKCFTVMIKVDASFYKSGSFSKFYLEIDNESPGQVGGWIGWQIVRSYMKTMKYLATSRFKC
jgi:hypothetical protein